tara:strand:- start:2828 stop:3850 length:1023 start_codon:yes stop_codon:yes gene_type:complete
MSRESPNNLWFEHPRFLVAKDILIKKLLSFGSNSSKSSKLTKLPSDARRALFGGAKVPQIVFICGGDPKYHPNRSIIESYLNKHEPDFMTFRAEYAWEIISSGKITQNDDGSVNALELEEWLADFSDAVIILVESYGTVAELGAFSISSRLRKKLLPILDKKFETDASFINTGPVSWVDNDSIYKPTIYADFDTILTTMPLMINKLRDGSAKLKRDRTSYGVYKFSRKELLFAIVIIITSIGPINENNIYDVCQNSFGLNDLDSEVKFIISLCVALGIIEGFEYKGVKLYTCLNYEKLYRNEATNNLLDVSRRLRFLCISRLLYIEDFNKAIVKVIKKCS